MGKKILAAAAACMLAFPFVAAAAAGNCDGLSTIRSAAEKGNATAQLNMGAMYLQGLCVEQNDREAFKWFLESAEGGNAQAQYMVGNMYLYHKGVDGDIYSRINAAGVWMGKACDKGVAEACRQAARAKFTEVTTAAGPLKQQVELCFFDLETFAGGSNPDTGATSCSDDQWGTGWNLVNAVRETKSEYVQAASVKNGVISMTSRNISVYGNDSFTLILVPHQEAYGSGGDTALNWTIAPESTCKQAGIC